MAIIRSDWAVTPLAAHVEVRAGRLMPDLAPDLEARISEHWARALIAYPGLYNGRVFCVDNLESDAITGHWSEYRRVFAQMREPGLYGATPLRPLAVVGLLSVVDGIVIGQRAANSVYLPDHWQGAPAGNVESRDEDTAIDLGAQLLAECVEELGLTPEFCDVGACILACEHPRTHIVDVGLHLHVPLDFAALQARCVEAGNAEYQALHLIRPGEAVPDPIRPLLVPTLAAMLENS